MGKWYYSTDSTDRENTNTDADAIAGATGDREDRNTEIYEALGIAHVQVHETGKRALELYQLGDVREAIDVYTDETTPAVAEVQVLLHEMEAIEDAYIQRLLIESEAVRQQAVNAIVGISVIAVVAAIVAAYAMHKQIAQPIRRMAAVAE